MLPFSPYYDPSPLSPPPRPQSRMVVIKKKKRPSQGPEDELAVVKAAAWAWYQRHEAKPVREFDTTRSRRVPRPSRYKMEAQREISLNNAQTSQGSSPLHHLAHNSRLLDAHEIESISKTLDHLRQPPVGPSKHEPRDREGVRGHNPRTVVCKSKLLKSVLFRHGAMCGRSNDVDARAVGRSTVKLRPQDGRR